MKVWVMQGSYEGEMFSSVHMTQKGCALACITDILDFLSVNDRDSALSVMRDMYAYTENEKAIQTAEEPFEWDHNKLKEMTSEQLWKIFADWCEMSWDRMADRSYNLDANAVEIQA